MLFILSSFVKLSVKNEYISIKSSFNCSTIKSFFFISLTMSIIKYNEQKFEPVYSISLKLFGKHFLQNPDFILFGSDFTQSLT